VAAMDTSDLYQARFVFIEAMSIEFVLRTGCGIYVYFNPVDVEDLFINYRNQGLSIKAFANQIIRNVLG
jgi:hypothetical protein